MEIEHIKEFLVLSTVLNYERAADILYISQSSLFKHIKALETDIGVELFSKNGKCIALTDAGERFISYAKKFEALDESFRRGLLNENNFNNYKFRIYTERPQTELMLDFNLRHPNYQVDNFYGKDGLDGIKILVTNEADVAILENPSGLDEEQFEIIPFERRPLALLVYDTHPLAKRKVVEASELRDEKFVSFALFSNGKTRYDQFFLEAHFEPHIVVTATSDESLQRMVREKFGIALVFENLIDYHVNGLKLINLKTDISRNNYLCFRKQEKYPQALNDFIEYAKKHIRWDGK